MLIHIMEQYIMVKEMVDYVIAKMKLIVAMHKAMLGNVEQAQVKKTSLKK